MKQLIIILILLISTNIAHAKKMSVEMIIDCGVKSAIKYNIPADTLLAIATIESGDYDTAYINSNGTLDYGIMQINTVYLEDLENNYNMIVSPQDLLKLSCYSFEIAAMKVSNHLKNDKGALLQRVANYHSKTTDLNRYYQTLLIKHTADWRKILASREYMTYLWKFNK